MSIEAVFFIGTALFLIAIFMIFIKDDAISVFVAYQIIITAAVINLLNFSMQAGAEKLWAGIFLFPGLLTIYLLIFSVFFHIYSKGPAAGKKAFVTDCRLFSLNRSHWWGEDRI
jgi:NADH:ubiquinone oxidoreductase subunit K